MDADQQRAVDAIVKHDRDSTGAELVYYFVHELGVLEREAWQIVMQKRRELVATCKENFYAATQLLHNGHKRQGIFE